MVWLFQVGECFDKHRPIVGNNLAKCTPLAQDVLKDPISDGLYGFCMEGTIFGEMRKRAVALYKVLEAA